MTGSADAPNTSVVVACLPVKAAPAAATSANDTKAATRLNFSFLPISLSSVCGPVENPRILSELQTGIPENKLGRARL